MVIRLESPLAIKINSKRQFILNLNNYRNAYFRTLNSAKVNYKAYMKDQILNEIYKPLEKIAIQYKVFKGDRRRFDIGNVTSIHQKFFEDAIVELGKLPDDRHENLPLTFDSFGGISTDRPRVEITIYDLTERSDIKMLLEDIRENLK
ncbi:MAG: hypothetical protein II393_00700 [Cytophagales bacterium]|nr:hypothetical protein [Cytophagales bacterium]MBQ5919001.1 hypothetical protein [Lachnospiraceae bacterium]